MYEGTRPPVCAGHPSRRARAACVRCGRYLCGECLEVGEEGALCPDCAGEAAGRACPPPAPGREAGKPGKGACVRHPDERATAVCAHCGAALCEGCRSGVGDLAYCPDCFTFVCGLRAAAGTPSRPARPRRSGSPEGGPGWKLWPGLAFLPLPFLLESLVTYMINEGGELGYGAAVMLVSAALYATLLAFAAWQAGGAAGGGGGWLRELGMSGRGLKECLPWGLLGGLVSFGLTAALLSASDWFLQNSGLGDNWVYGLIKLNVKAGVGGLDMVLAFVVIVLVAPFCEEAFFRGYLYPPMRRELGTAWAMLLSSAVFSLVHFSLVGLLSRMAAGLVFCALYEHADNLAAPVAAHMINNLVAFLLPVVGA